MVTLVELLALTLPDEQVYVILKSFKDDFIFTDCALITRRGNSTIGTKKHVFRHDYCESSFSGVSLRTPGIATLDRDGVLRFIINEEQHEVDIRKDEWHKVFPLYHALIALQRAQHMNAATAAMQREIMGKVIFNVDPGQALEAVSAFATEQIAKYQPVSYKHILEYYLKR